jgi:hypothetical protein
MRLEISVKCPSPFRKYGNCWTLTLRERKFIFYHPIDVRDAKTETDTYYTKDQMIHDYMIRNNFKGPLIEI